MTAPASEKKIHVGDRLAFLSHALFRRGMDKEAELIAEAITEMATLHKSVREARNAALEEAAVRGRIAQLENKLVDVEIRALKA